MKVKKKCWHHLAFCHMLMSLAFLQQGKVKKSKNLLQGNNRRKSAYLPNDLRNFNKIVNKNVHNIKSPEKWGFRLLSRKYSLWGGGGGAGWQTAPPTFLGLKMVLVKVFEVWVTTLLFYWTYWAHFVYIP